jgi:hypothetical protein
VVVTVTGDTILGYRTRIGEIERGYHETDIDLFVSLGRLPVTG